MQSFAEIRQIAEARKGGDVVPSETRTDVAATSDQDWLRTMARAIFQTGISWQVVENKWEGIEEAFDNFDVARVAFYDEDRMDELMADTRVIRSGPKLLAIRHNAAFIQEVSAEAGSFGAKIAAWPADDFAGLTLWLKNEGSRLGGNTGPYVLRQMGRDGWILSQDVTARLVEEGVISGPATSSKALRAVQSAFDTWSAESGLGFTQISRVLAQSIDG